MKRLFAMLLAATLTLSLAACTPASTTSGSSGSASASTSSQPAKKVEYNKGTLTATTFESEFLNLKYTAGKDLIMATEADMSAMADFGEEIAYKDADKKILDYSRANTVYEMGVSSSTAVPSAYVLVEKLSLSNMTTTQYLDSLKGQLGAMAEMGATFEDKYSKITVAGAEYEALKCSISAGGIKAKQDYLVRKIDNRIACILVTYTEETADQAKAILDSFVAFAK